MYPVQNRHISISETTSDWNSLFRFWWKLVSIIPPRSLLPPFLVVLIESRFQGMCLSCCFSRVFALGPSLLISLGILIRALWAPAGERRDKLCYLTPNKNLIMSLIQVAHLKKNYNYCHHSSPPSFFFNTLFYLIYNPWKMRDSLFAV